MASSSSSKAAEMPEWEGTLRRTPEPRSLSQNNLLRSIAILNDLVAKCKSNNSARDSDLKFLLKLAAGLVEMSRLGIEKNSILKVYPEAHSLLHATLMPYEFNNGIEMLIWLANPNQSVDSNAMPAMLFCVLSEFWDQIINTLIIVQFCVSPEYQNDRYLEAVSRMKGWVSKWQSFEPRWAELKAAGCDDLLREIGSSLTVDQLHGWSNVFVVVGLCADYLGAEGNFARKALTMMEAADKWARKLLQSEQVDLFEYYCARQIAILNLTVLEEGNMARSKNPPSPALAQLIKRSWVPLGALFEKVFKREVADVKALVPRDPAHISVAYSWYAQFAMTRAAHEVMPLIEESKKAVAEAKAYLPPAVYKPLKHDVKFREQNVRDRYGFGGHNRNDDAWVPGQMERGSLDQRCACCHINGTEKALQCCAQCRKVYYCSKECQKKDWKVHKKVCKAGSSANIDAQRQ